MCKRDAMSSHDRETDRDVAKRKSSLDEWKNG